MGAEVDVQLSQIKFESIPSLISYFYFHFSNSLLPFRLFSTLFFAWNSLLPISPFLVQTAWGWYLLVSRHVIWVGIILLFSLMQFVDMSVMVNSMFSPFKIPSSWVRESNFDVLYIDSQVDCTLASNQYCIYSARALSLLWSTQNYDECFYIHRAFCACIVGSERSIHKVLGSSTEKKTTLGCRENVMMLWQRLHQLIRVLAEETKASLHLILVLLFRLRWCQKEVQAMTISRWRKRQILVLEDECKTLRFICCNVNLMKMWLCI